MTAGVLAVRLKRGQAGESGRVVHTVVVPDDAPVVNTLTTVCGQVFEHDQVDIVGRVGMPCMACVSRMATNGAAMLANQYAPASDRVSEEKQPELEGVTT